ncbi:MAG: hypothetical protein V3W18_05315, partial [candidate division Zixibacteria bacterium]
MAANLLSEHCLDLKRAYQKNMALGFGISATVHLAAIGTILMVMAIGSKGHIDVPEITINTIQKIMLPPSISTPPEQVRIKLEERQIPPSMGLPEAVPDDEAPEEILVA